MLDRLRFYVTDVFVRIDSWVRRPHWWDGLWGG